MNSMPRGECAMAAALRRILATTRRKTSQEFLAILLALAAALLALPLGATTLLPLRCTLQAR